MTKVTDSIYYVGVNDHEVDLFEGQYDVPNGMSYNSYVIMDEKIAVMDTVDQHFTEPWLQNIEAVLDGKKPDYLIVQHMEPDHSANIQKFAETYPDAVIVANEMIFQMIGNYFTINLCDRKKVVGDGESISLGAHTLTFVFAPMVHWPEVMVTYDSTDKVLFSADGFGKFGALDVEEDWDDEARRYFIGIVGKYGSQVQTLLSKAATLDIQKICPLHGPILTENLGHYLTLYDRWSSYRPEEEGIVVAYTSVYGNTKKAALQIAALLEERACPKVVVHDLARDDMAECVADAFRYSKLILATTTYNGEIYPFMREFIDHLTERNFQNRTIGLVENGSWAPQACQIMRDKLAVCKNIIWMKNRVSIKSSIKQVNEDQMTALADEICRDYMAHNDALANKHDVTALFKIGYGLYVVTSNDGEKDNGLIVNTVCQVAEGPNRFMVNINKANYSHDVIKKTGKMNVNVLSIDAPFSVFQRFGFQSGRTADKFEGMDVLKSGNGLAYLPEYINAMISLKVTQYVDMGSHGMFICEIEESRTMSDRDTMTYTYYQGCVKPRPKTDDKKGFVCKVCGYIYEGETLPENYICPLCKHGVDEFEKTK